MSVVSTASQPRRILAPGELAGGMRHARYQRLPTVHLDRPVHLWTYGWFGAPVLVFPSAAGMAHEWQHSGAIKALQPWIDAGLIKLYCPESNVSVAWTGDGDPAWRLEQHARYERFITEEMVNYIRTDCASPNIRIATTGCSFGAYYAVNTAVKHPDLFNYALGMSGRYRPEAFLEDYRGAELYMHHPMAHVSGLSGDELKAAQGVEIVLVAGQGNYEGRCTAETRELAAVMQSKGIPATLDIWGHDVSHEWVWWRRQLLHHLGRRFA